jgi:hypothetical protein
MPDQVVISRVDLQTGWVMFEGGRPAPPREDLPALLTHTMERWLEQNPHIIVRAVLPIIQRGTTVALHVWFD